MHQSELIANISIKRINQNPNSNKSAEISEEDIEVSYNEVLRDEVSRMSKRHKHNVNNQSKHTTHTKNGNNSAQEMESFSSHFPASLQNLNHRSRQVHRPHSHNFPRPEHINKGDIDGDGRINQADVAALEKYVNGDDIKIKSKNADINGDKKITKEDVEALQKFVNPNIGDVNGDGKVTQADVHALREYNAGNTSKINKKNADMNGDGKVTSSDIDKLQNFVKELHPDMGDANGDGKVNQKDIDLVKQKYVGYDVELNMDKADIDGNGEITISDLAEVTNIVNKKESHFEKITGDTNGDGVVNESDYINLKNYIDNVESSADFVRKNSDINGDKIIDEKDLQGIRDKLDGINVNYSEAGVLGDVNGDGELSIADLQAIKNYNNRKSNGDQEFYINNADINNDGKIDNEDVKAGLRTLRGNSRPEPRLSRLHNIITESEPVRSNTTSSSPHSTDNITNDNVRPSRLRDIINGPGSVRPNTPSSPLRPINHVTHDRESRPTYEPWTDTVRQFQPIFSDSDLSNRSGSEFINVGIKINVISETNNAYRVQYPTSRGEQIGWIGKNAFQRPTSNQTTLQSLISEFVGKIWQNDSSGIGIGNGMESKNFASFIFDQMNNIGDIGNVGNRNRGNNYRININANFVGLRGSNQYLTRYNAKSLFRDAQVGDFVQMRRHNGDSHSAILTEINARGVQLLESNAPDSNGSFVYNKINLTFYSYERLAGDNASMSLYYPKGEEV